MNHNILLYITIIILFVLFILINFIKIRQNKAVYNNINNEKNKSKYYYDKMKIINFLNNIVIIVMIFMLLMEFIVCNTSDLFYFESFYISLIVILICLVVALLIEVLNINKKIDKIREKYEIDVDKKIIKIIDNYNKIFIFFVIVLFVVNILLLNAIKGESDNFKLNITAVIIFLSVCLLLKLIFETIISVKTCGDWFKYVKIILRIFTKKPDFVFLGTKPVEPSIHLCNHVGSKGPLRLELYYDHDFNFWGTHEMNGGFKSIYKYLSTTYFQGKKHFKPFIAKVIGFVATPFLRIIYLGLKLIPTYTDMRLKNTIKESIKEIENKRSIIIFPENSANGYFDVIKEFEPGFILLLEKLYKKDIDLPVYVMYYQKDKNRYIVDEKVMISSLFELNLSREELAEKMKERCNELSKY